MPSSLSSPLAVLVGVTKTYTGRHVLKDFDFALEPGTVTALLGPNGAGKSTVAGLITGRLAADAGIVSLFGLDPRDQMARARMGIMLQSGGLPETLTVAEAIDLQASYFARRLPTAKVAATAVFCAIAFVLLYGLGVRGGVTLGAGQWAALASVHTLAIIPFSLIGLGIGYRLGQKGAIAAANIVFLALAVLGGLWLPVAVLPPVLQSLPWVLPSYHLGKIALMTVGQRDPANLWLHAGPLVLITAAAGLFAWTGERAQGG